MPAKKLKWTSKAKTIGYTFLQYKVQKQTNNKWMYMAPPL